MNTPLFRNQAVQAQTNTWLGTVRLTRPISFSVVTGCALACAGLLVAFTYFGEINRKATVTGMLVPATGTLNVVASQTGVITALGLVEGQIVHAGDVLMVITADQKAIMGGTVGSASDAVALQIDLRQQSLRSERTIRSLQASQRDQALSDRVRGIQAELRQSTEEIELQTRRVSLIRTTLLRNEQLAKDGFVSASQVQSKQEELIDANARLQGVTRSHFALQRDLTDLLAQRRALTTDLQAELAQLDRSSSSLTQDASQIAARNTSVITAPFTGVVTAINVIAGQSVQSSQPLATIIPSDGKTPPALLAQLYASSRDAGFIQSGQNVYMRYGAYPFQKFGLHKGTITSISQTPLTASELPPHLSQQIMSRAGSNEALYRINVKLDDQSIKAYGADMRLKAGMTLDADVLQERRKIWEWVLAPVLAARYQVKVLNAGT